MFLKAVGRPEMRSYELCISNNSARQDTQPASVSRKPNTPAHTM